MNCRLSAKAGGPIGAVAGRQAGESVGELFAPPPLTRNALADRSFSTKVAEPVQYPQVNLRAVPGKPVRGGAAAGLPTPLSDLFAKLSASLRDMH